MMPVWVASLALCIIRPKETLDIGKRAHVHSVALLNKLYELEGNISRLL